MSEHTDRVIREYSPPQPPGLATVIIVATVLDLLWWWLS
jgi:hypothetical protein